LKKNRKQKTHPSRKVGLPPGSLVHVGEVKIDRPVISLIEYDDLGLDEQRFGCVEDAYDYKPARERLWLNVHGLNDADMMAEIGRRFHLHPLAMEDILNTHQRPKIDDYGDYLFVVLRIFDFDESSHCLVSDQLSIVIGKRFVLTFQERAQGIFQPVRERLRASRSPMRQHGIDYLAYALLDTVIDRYFVTADRLGEDAETLEDDALNRPTPALLTRINQAKRETLQMRRAVWPLRDVISSMQRADNDFFTPDTRLYLRDIHDHTLHVIESLDGGRELLGDLLDIYLSSVSNRLNVEVRTLTVLSMLFMPATLIAGIFGMNFHDMPLLAEHDGFWVSMFMMGACALFMGGLFWRRQWLRQNV